ncbi:hypothetical protein O6H91_09G081000 [Diphasiastrum complanatum]|nr:hypothetical protein O6H91_09G081000 [Diphasiastrum complanatum]
MLKFYRATLGEGFNVCRFQEPGRAERDFARFPIKDCLKAAFLNKKLLIAPPDKEIMDVIEVPKALPQWITEEYFDYLAEQFHKSGFTGPLNYYRAMDLTWEQMAPWTDKGTDVPVLFITGDEDMLYKAPGAKEYIHGGKFVQDVPNLQDIVVLCGGHFIHQESPSLVNKHILNFFDSLRSNL